MITLHYRTAAPSEVHLGDGEIHLWRQRFSRVDESTVVSGLEQLSRNERDRLERISDPARRARVAISRIFLRETVGAYIGCEPARVQLLTGPKGRPDLKEGQVTSPISFNLSHSGDYLALAIAATTAVGLDIETIEPRGELERVIARCFSESEIQALRASGDNQLESFFRGWTRKEALLKAEGAGVFSGARAIEVSLADVYMPSILRLRGDREQARQWTLLSLQPREDMVGAVAVPHGNWRLRLLERPI